jgi:hypothetical protein
MEKDQETQSRSRLTLDLSTRMTSALNAYAEKHGVSKADVLRTALDLLMVADRAVDDGLSVGAWKIDNNQRIEREFVGI